MPYANESTGPGRHRYQITGRTWDSLRTAKRGFSSGRVLSDEEIEYFHNLRRAKQMTPTEIVYNRILNEREKRNGSR